MGDAPSMRALRPPARLDQVVVHRVAGSRSTRGDLELAVDRGQVRIHRSGTDDELLSDLSVSESLRHESQHLDFAGGQAVGKGR